jgi:methanol--5-hydroxybenzimidazolylcobamide Co-methyltransferase
MKRYTSLAIDRPEALLYGTCPSPLETRSGMVLGGGTVYPELNFTLPSMLVTDETFDKVREHYRQIISAATRRAAELEVPGVVIEFEALPDMTRRPAWAIELCGILLEGMEQAHSQWGLKSVLRMTPNDNREMLRPPLMRSGEHWESMLETFTGCAKLGAELLSIESVGGKEVHDDAISYGDIRGALFALAVLGARDMEFLWANIVRIAEAHGVHAAGDTACGFANTAMVLADKGMIPKVFAAVDRAISAVRSLVAYQCGAVGPGKDCGYENPICRAITGLPMSMEGKSAACAHLSAVGNLPMGLCDCWSNESVQNVKLLSAMAPTVSMEQLAYDCRLLNRASRDGDQAARTLRDWLVDSDAALDPQAYILTPDSVIRLARAIVAAEDDYHAGCNAGREALAILREGADAGAVHISQRERPYLDLFQQQLDELPDQEEEFVEQMLAEVDVSKFRPAEYGIEPATSQG